MDRLAAYEAEKPAAGYVEDVTRADEAAAPINTVDVTYGANTHLTTEQAKQGQENQKQLTAWEAVKIYKKALFWSWLLSLCVIMEGYDTILIGNFYAYPTFARKYGSYFAAQGNYQVPAPWQAGLGNASGIGAFFGVALNGILVDRFGQKSTILGSLICLSCFLFIVFFAPNIGVLTAGELLCGLPWGIFCSSSPAYASEVLPLQLRVYMTSYTNMCFVTGQLIAAGVLDGCVTITSQWGYRIPFAVQWVWPCIIFPIMLFCPESPWHLVRKGRLEEAERSLRRLQSKTSPVDVRDTLATIVRTNQLEEELAVGTSYADCFKGVELRRTEIACMVFAGQILSGLVFAYNASYFFQQVGLDTRIIYKLNVGGTALALFSCFFTWFAFMPYFGRRTIYVYGSAAMTVVLLIIGILESHSSNKHVGLTQAVLTLLWTCFFQLSVGQLGWALPAEMGSTRLRQKTVCLARNAYYIVSVIGSVLEPYMINPTQWGLKGYVGFFWGGACLILTVWAYFRLPETKGRTFDELDLMFAKRVPAREFARYEIDAFDVHQNAELAAQTQARHSISH